MKTPEELRQAWQELKAQAPRIFPRDAAEKLGIAEAQLIALRCGSDAHRLDISDPVKFLNEAMQFGEAMFIVRNDTAVLEMDGAPRFEAKEHAISGSEGNFLLAFGNSTHATVFAVYADEGMKRGIQFFNEAGAAIFKIYFHANASLSAIDAWLKPWISGNQSHEQPVISATETHACSKTAAACHGEQNAETPLPADVFKAVFTAATKSGELLTLSLCNANCHFCVTAPVGKVAAMGPWFNILDKKLHLHLTESRVKSAAAEIDDAAKSLKITLKNEAGVPVLRIRAASFSAIATEIACQK